MVLVLIHLLQKIKKHTRQCWACIVFHILSYGWWWGFSVYSWRPYLNVKWVYEWVSVESADINACIYHPGPIVYVKGIYLKIWLSLAEQVPTEYCRGMAITRVASIPLTLCSSKISKPEKRLLMAGFGEGSLGLQLTQIYRDSFLRNIRGVEVMENLLNRFKVVLITGASSGIEQNKLPFFFSQQGAKLLYWS